MSANKNLHKARAVRNDEFYTRRVDIDKELSYYADAFKGMTVYCPCDNPRKSNFVRYFVDNFETLGLKKLIASCYSHPGDLWTPHGDGGFYIEYTGGAFDDVIEHRLRGDGDFRSVECTDLLKESDIVVTNPPFSLFRDFIGWVVGSGKRMVVIGNLGSVMYKDIFALFKRGEIFLGIMGRIGTFMTPDGEKSVNGAWFTNIPNHVHKSPLELTKTYNPVDYPKYDNYDAIEVSKTRDIPIDYDGVMGVPVTFLEKWVPPQFDLTGFMNNPKQTMVNGGKKYARVLIKKSDQFDLVGADFEVADGKHPSIVNPEWTGKLDKGYIDGNRRFGRVLIKKSDQFEIVGAMYSGNDRAVVNGKMKYARVLIKPRPPRFDVVGLMNSGESNDGIRLPNTAHGRPVINGVEKYTRILIKPTTTADFELIGIGRDIAGKGLWRDGKEVWYRCFIQRKTK